MTTASSPTQSDRRLYFVTAVEDGWTNNSWVRLSTVKDPVYLESFFDDLFGPRKAQRKESDWDERVDQYHLPRLVLNYIYELVSEKPTEESMKLNAEDIRTTDLAFPWDWKKADWGEWGGFEAADVAITDGKHYHYVSWW